MTVRSTVQKIILLTLLCLLTGAAESVLAQSSIPGWIEPQNLSVSGAASQPRIVTGDGDRVQVFWWDVFDGMMTSVSEGQPVSPEAGFDWSPPQKTPIQSLGLTGMPTIVADRAGWVHAFWLEENTFNKGTYNLMHSRLTFGKAEWSFPQILAEAALSFKVGTAPSGEISLAYVRQSHTPEQPAGIYVMRNAGGDSEWRAARLVYESIYFRLLERDQVWLWIWDAGGDQIFLTWDDPHLGLAFFSTSSDAGASWSEPEQVGKAEERAVRPRVAALPDGEVLRIWQASIHSRCTLFMQRAAVSTMGENDEEPTEDTLQWSQPERVLEGLAACPAGDAFHLMDTQLLWVWGEGTGRLELSAWEDSQKQWSIPHVMSFNFQSPSSQEQVILNDLRASFLNERIVVAGADSSKNEVWFTSARSDVLELVYSPPSPWSSTYPLSLPGEKAGQPAVAVDDSGIAHIVWTKSRDNDDAAVNMMYAHWDGNELTPPVTILRSGDTAYARQPVLLADRQNRLHLVWVGGLDGKIYHSYVIAQDARSSSSWTSPQVVGDLTLTSSPQVGVDAAGRLYILFVVPLNEQRGLYLAVSEDGGRNWSEPRLIFNAREHGWQMVDHPALIVEPGGIVHIAWVNVSIPGATTPPQGIFYSRSVDQGKTWSSPLIVVGPGYDHPRLAIASGQVHLLFADAQKNLWHRWIPYGDLALQGDLWSVATRIPGWQEVDLPFAVAVDGIIPNGTLHLLGGKGTAEDRPLYAYWDGSRWSSLEWFSFVSRPASLYGAAAAVRLEGGMLAAAWLAPYRNDDPALVLNFISRAIPEIQLPVTGQLVVEVASTPTATPTVEPSPTPEPTQAPTPTPDLNRQPLPAARLGLPPLALGGGLAALIVFAGLITHHKRRR
jgi:hypothetical protein